jgi:hypothetical protein
MEDRSRGLIEHEALESTLMKFSFVDKNIRPAGVVGKISGIEE